MGRLTKRHGKHAVQIGGETRRHDVGWLRLAHYEDLEEQGRLIEQKHGTWEESKNFDDCFWVCSNCKFPSEATAAPIIYNYCPNCGAKMGVE